MSRHHLNRPARFAVSAVLGLFALALAAGNTCAGRLGDELQQQLATVAAATPLKVTIRFADRVDLAPFARRSDRHAARREMIKALRDRAAIAQGPLQKQLRGQGHKVDELWLINALATELPAAEITALSAWPGVDSVELTGTTPPPEPTPLAEPVAAPLVDWNITAIGAPTLWSNPLNVDGSGIVVAVLDTGVDRSHPAISSKFRGLAGDWYDPYGFTALPYDFPTNGLTHGTAVTSVVLGTSTGVAPGAQWIAAKIFPDSGSADNTKIHQAFAWALNPDGDLLTDDAPDIVNASWGFDASANLCLTTFQADIEALQAAGINVVFAAGNKGPNPATSVSPANLSVGFAVGAATGVTAYGATTPGTVVSSFSSRGPSPCPGVSPYLTPTNTDVFPEITAPGYSVVVANSESVTNYSIVAGTSFAAPHVSGALALLRQAVPNGGQAATDYRLGLELALLDSAADFDLPSPDQNSGYGLLDVAAAYYRLSGQPSLAAYTPGAPENDELVDFGNVPRTGSTDLTLRLANVGGGDLSLTLPASLTAPYSIVAETCPAVLAQDAACSVTIRFAPMADGPATASFTVSSNDPRNTSRIINLAGSANTAPPIPIPVAPADGVRNQLSQLTFSWYQGDDSDGDPLTSNLYLGIDEEFQLDPLLITPGSVIPQAAALLLLLPLPLLLYRRTRRLLPVLLASALLLSCGGGGGGSSPPTPNYSATVSGLTHNTTYYWKVVTSDGQGNPVESPVRSFTTAP